MVLLFHFELVFMCEWKSREDAIGSIDSGVGYWDFCVECSGHQESGIQRNEAG